MTISVNNMKIQSYNNSKPESILLMSKLFIEYSNRNFDKTNTQTRTSTPRIMLFLQSCQIKHNIHIFNLVKKFYDKRLSVSKTLFYSM